MIDRRTVLGAIAGAGRQAGSGGVGALPPLFDDIAERTFQFFWRMVNRSNGLVPDRWPTVAPASIAGVGFALTAYPIGVERGWIKRDEAADVTLTTLRFFAGARQGPATRGTSGHRGFFYHFLDMATGLRAANCELSSVDTALLLMGVLFAANWYSGQGAREREIRELAARIIDAADWRWFERSGGTISMGWHPGRGFLRAGWGGYNEGMMVVLLALGSRRHPVDDGAWERWTATYDRCWRGSGDTRHIAFAPLFGHQYSHMWIDFRRIRDVVMRGAGFDYFENSRRATYANRAWCVANPRGWTGYGPDLWGLTACDGPGTRGRDPGGRDHLFRGYSARGPTIFPDGFDDGTIAPTAALGSLAFAPEICVSAAEALRRRPGLYGSCGFRDSFNPSCREIAAPAASGTVDPAAGWVARDYLSIDQGPILGAIANYRSDLIWQTMRRSASLRRGLRRAGFAGGWLADGMEGRGL